MPDSTRGFVTRLPAIEEGWLSLARSSTSVSIASDRVVSWDLTGRPYALVRPEGTYRRALDGHLLLKSSVRGRRQLHVSTAEEAEDVCERARQEVLELRSCFGSLPDAVAQREALQRLEVIAAMDGPALRRDADRFREIYRPVGILPPDQYLALVVQLTEGCSWDACTFCDLYARTPFRVRSPDELTAHVQDVRRYLGAGLALRRSAFLGAANALCLAHEKLAPLLEIVTAGLPELPALYSFVDAWTGERKRISEWRTYAGFGLRRVYVGLETGDPELLAWLHKPGTPDAAVALVDALHEAGLAVGVIVLIGAGGTRFAGRHVRNTRDVLRRMQLGRDDIVYFSELVMHPTLEYARRATEPDLKPLPPEACTQQTQDIRSGLAVARSGPRVAHYDIREFVY